MAPGGGLLLPGGADQLPQGHPHRRQRARLPKRRPEPRGHLHHPARCISSLQFVDRDVASRELLSKPVLRRYCLSANSGLVIMRSGISFCAALHLSVEWWHITRGKRLLNARFVEYSSTAVEIAVENITILSFKHLACGQTEKRCPLNSP